MHGLNYIKKSKPRLYDIKLHPVQLSHIKSPNNFYHVILKIIILYLP